MAVTENIRIARTTIETSATLMDAVRSKATENSEDIRDFITRALLNQLETEGNFEIRDEVEEELNGGCEKKISTKKGTSKGRA